MSSTLQNNKTLTRSFMFDGFQNEFGLGIVSDFHKLKTIKTCLCFFPPILRFSPSVPLFSSESTLLLTTGKSETSMLAACSKCSMTTFTKWLKEDGKKVENKENWKKNPN